MSSFYTEVPRTVDQQTKPLALPFLTFWEEFYYAFHGQGRVYFVCKQSEKNMLFANVPIHKGIPDRDPLRLSQ